MPGLENEIGAFGFFAQPSDIVVTIGHGLLAKHMLARIKGGNGDIGVGIERRGDDNGIDILLVQQRPVITVGAGLLIAVAHAIGQPEGQ